MAYKLEKPCSVEKRDNFIAEYNQNCHQNRNYILEIYETENAIFALEPNEIILNGEIVINPQYEIQTKIQDLKDRVGDYLRNKIQWYILQNQKQQKKGK